MLIQLRPGDMCILAYVSDTLYRGLSICWNDRSGRTLNLSDYDEQLMYKREPYIEDPSQYDIMAVYGVGNYFEPFSMHTSNRFKLWERDKQYYSMHDKLLASQIRILLESIYNQYLTCFVERDREDLIIKDEKDLELLRIPDSSFYSSFKEGEKVPLTAIINFKENEVCQDTSTKTS